ncbi:MAG: peptide chain release factor 1 [Saprospiraceae bacterium]|nr:peptide chain release factor 1 [Saprospiraceae bacterium]
MIEKLVEIEAHFKHLEEQMTDPEILSNIDRYSKINKEYKDLQEIMAVFAEYRNVLSNIESARNHLKDPDEEMREMAGLEVETLEDQKEELDEQLKYLLIPRDPDDTKDVVFEIRSGTGGDEAAIFAGDLYRMYTKYFETQSWKQEIMQINEGTVGGYSKIVLEVSGLNVYGKLKFESGAHRVQRVPVTEAQGRVHTSAATVVVMPKLEMDDVDIKKSDLKVDTFRSSGAGGQHVNKTESGVRFTHLPTGLVAESTDGRSQIKNREIAIQRLYQKIYESQRIAYENEQASKRRSLVGTGDRSDKIRTYNYPQNRVTDHRINLTLYNLDRIMEGDLETILEGLQVAENAEKLKGEMV